LLVCHSRHNVIGAATLAWAPYLERCLPCSVVTADGRWLDREDIPVGQLHSAAEHDKQRAWLGRVKETLAVCSRDYVACVDVHS
jgi:hypothetical protein